MNCDKVRQLLSAFHDGELPASKIPEVERHLTSCADCREALASVDRVGQIARKLLDNSRVVDLWPNIASQLNEEVSPRRSLVKDWFTRRVLAVVAVASVAVVGVGIVTWRDQIVPTADQRTARILDRYLEEFVVSPLQAQKLLDREFPYTTVEQAENSNFAKTSMIGLRATLPGLTRVAMHVRNLPCCDCVQGLYQRADGSYITVFEHEMPVTWDTKRQGREVQCGDCVCRLRQLDSRIAASWEHDDRYFTVIGANGEEELKQIVERLDPSESTKSIPSTTTSES